MCLKSKFNTEEEKKQHDQEYPRDYYEMNKDKIKENLYQVIHCSCCDKEIMKYKFQRHCRSLRHQKNEAKDICQT